MLCGRSSLDTCAGLTGRQNRGAYLRVPPRARLNRDDPSRLCRGACSPRRGRKRFQSSQKPPPFCLCFHSFTLFTVSAPGSIMLHSDTAGASCCLFHSNPGIHHIPFTCGQAAGIPALRRLLVYLTRMSTTVFPTANQISEDDMTLKDSIAIFVDHYLAAKGDRPTTLRWYRNRLEQFQRWVEKRQNADIEDAGLLDAYVASLYARGLKQSTVNGHVRVLRTFYKYLVARGLVCYNAAGGLWQKVDQGRVPRAISRQARSWARPARWAGACSRSRRRRTTADRRTRRTTGPQTRRAANKARTGVRCHTRPHDRAARPRCHRPFSPAATQLLARQRDQYKIDGWSKA